VPGQPSQRRVFVDFLGNSRQVSIQRIRQPAPLPRLNNQFARQKMTCALQCSARLLPEATHIIQAALFAKLRYHLFNCHLHPSVAPPLTSRLPFRV